MKNTEFSDFFNNLQSDMETYEHFGFAFLQMTDRQIVKVIDFYSLIKECEVFRNHNGMFIRFGLHRSFAYPLDKYMEISKNESHKLYIEYLKQHDLVLE